MYKMQVTIGTPEGVHARIAAEIVNKAQRIKKDYGTELYIKKAGDSSPIAIGMIAILSLRIEMGDIIEISSKYDDDKSKIAVNELCSFISNLCQDKSISSIDYLLNENSIANEQILESLSIGIVVCDINSSIIYINSYMLNILNCKIKDILGKDMSNIINNYDLNQILKSGNSFLGDIVMLNNREMAMSLSPIIFNKNIIGAVGTFQDISELIAVKELNEKLKKILECSSDLICFVDENRKISYINPAYEKCFNINSKDTIGKDLMDMSPNGLRMKAFTTKKKIENISYEKHGVELISRVEPLFINNNFNGILSISKPVNEIKDLIKKLEHSEEELKYYKEQFINLTKEEGAFKNIIGNNSSLRDAIFIARKAANSISTVLIRGESGTGKELIAKAIHNSSDRKDKPFIKINCAAIPENLFESELFGYEKGAFTGAYKNKIGKFTLADGGTVFLDEIGDMPKSMQVKLLRVLQEKEFESVGGLTTHKVDIRVIAATNRNLEEMIENGEFRKDLYYRLNVMSIFLPPLRNRKEDIGPLTEHFIEKLNLKLNKNILGINKESMNCLLKYDWPGNIRELENIIERAMNMCDGNIISIRDLPLFLTNISSKSDSILNLLEGDMLKFEDYEREIIKAAMEKYKTYNKAGKVLGLTHRTISLKCEKYGISK
ncbi:PAS domain S-box-containing protein [Caloramator quimbayensis]|uniref:HTH-type transcriptional regulatory protein TyrR n=1 Tax=Caloramator quimbayensis TaxID=1147123 RepID=A0A1T4YAL3_9CLOT|nr:sigma 54-interacting transcriptional regulator [Caloramator quimbayensis]SKA98730.1 PAS domain S-box-containing protein [Caloramator quimbayensis]